MDKIYKSNSAIKLSWLSMLMQYLKYNKSNLHRFKDISLENIFILIIFVLNLGYIYIFRLSLDII